MADFTKSELAIMNAIDATPNKVLGWTECRQAANLTIRGGRTVVNRLLDYGVIARSEHPDTYRELTLTFKGMRWLKEIANAN